MKNKLYVLSLSKTRKVPYPQYLNFSPKRSEGQNLLFSCTSAGATVFNAKSYSAMIEFLRHKSFTPEIIVQNIENCFSVFEVLGWGLFKSCEDVYSPTWWDGWITDESGLQLEEKYRGNQSYLTDGKFPTYALALAAKLKAIDNPIDWQVRPIVEGEDINWEFF